MDSYLASALATPEVLERDASDTLSKVSSHPSITPDDLDGVGVTPGAVQIEAGAQVCVAPPARGEADLMTPHVARSMVASSWHSTRLELHISRQMEC